MFFKFLDYDYDYESDEYSSSDEDVIDKYFLYDKSKYISEILNTKINNYVVRNFKERIVRCKGATERLQ